MQFHEVQTIYSYLKEIHPEHFKGIDPRAYYEEAITQNQTQNITGHDQMAAEQTWYIDRRPYYRIWPSLIAGFTRLKLDQVHGDDLTVPHNLHSLGVQMPKTEHVLNFEDATGKRYYLQSLLIRHSVFANALTPELRRKLSKGEPLQIEDYLNCPGRVIQLWLDYGEKDPVMHAPVLTYRNIPCVKGKTVEEILSGLTSYNEFHDIGVAVPDKFVDNCVRLAATLALLDSEDTELVVPDIITDDKRKYQEADESRKKALVEKAHRRGKIGWEVGKLLEDDTREVSAHYRRTHFGFRYVGKGKTQKRLTRIKGTIVHKEKLKEVPQGFLDEDTSEGVSSHL